MKNRILFILLFISVGILYIPSLNYPSFTAKWIAWGILSFLLAFSTDLKPKFTNLNILFILFFLWKILSIIWAKSSIATVNQLLYSFVIILSYFPIYAYIKDDKKNFYKEYIILLSITSFIISLTGILQYFGLITDLFNQRAVPAAMFVNKNFASPFMAFSIWWLILYIVKSKNIVVSLILTFDIFYLILSATRASWLSSLTSGFFFLIIIIKTKQTSKLISKPLIILYLLLFILILGTKFKPADVKVQRNFNKQIDSLITVNKSAQVRLNIWKNSIALIRSNPIIGYGIDNFNVVYPLFHNTIVKDRFYSTRYFEGGTHNEFIQILAETGLIGLLFFIFLILLLFYNSSKITDKYLSYSIILSTFALLINSSFSSTLHYPTYIFLLSLNIIITDGFYKSPKEFYLKSNFLKPIYLIILIAFSYISFLIIKSDYYFKKSNENFYKGNISYAWKYGEKATSYWKYNLQLLFNTTNYGYTLFLYDKKIKNRLVAINKLTLKALPYHFLPNFAYGLLLYENGSKQAIKKYLSKKDIILQITPENKKRDMKKLLYSLEKKL